MCGVPFVRHDTRCPDAIKLSDVIGAVAELIVALANIKRCPRHVRTYIVDVVRHGSRSIDWHVVSSTSHTIVPCSLRTIAPKELMSGPSCAPPAAAMVWTAPMLTSRSESTVLEPSMPGSDMTLDSTKTPASFRVSRTVGGAGGFRNTVRVAPFGRTHAYTDPSPVLNTRTLPLRRVVEPLR